MPGSFKFYTDSARATEAARDLSDAKVMVYEDGGENKYILDASDITNIDNIDELKLSNLKDIKIKYQPKDSSNPRKVEGLGNIIGKLFATKGTSDSKTILEEEVARKPVAEAILGATDSDGKKSILVEKLGGFLASTDEVKYDSAENAANQTAKDFLAEKSSLVKTDGSNATKELATAILTINGDTPGTSVLKEKVADKNVAEAILGATSDSGGKKSILVEKLGGFLEKTNEATEKVYGDPRTPSSLKVAKDFLNSKGLGTASASEVASQLLSDTKKDQLGTAILGVKKDVGGTLKPALETDLAANKTLQDAVAAVPALKTAVAADADLQAAVKSALAGDGTFKSAVRVAVNAEEIREVIDFFQNSSKSSKL